MMLGFQEGLMMIWSGLMGTLNIFSNKTGEAKKAVLWYPVYLPDIPSIFFPYPNNKSSYFFSSFEVFFHSNKEKNKASEAIKITTLGNEAKVYLAYAQER